MLLKMPLRLKNLKQGVNMNDCTDDIENLTIDDDDNPTINDDNYKGLSSKHNRRIVNKRVLKQFYTDISLLEKILQIDLSCIEQPKLRKERIYFVDNYEIKIKWKPNKNSTWIRPILIVYRKLKTI